MEESDRIPVTDFGGQGPPLHFAHANTYPPRCYSQIFQPLTAKFHVWAMEQRPLWAGQSPQQLQSWNLFADDLIRAMEQCNFEGIIGAGHSLGAAISMIAAVQRPALFRALVLIEPVLLPPALLEAARAHPEQADLMPLVQRARKRRNRWPHRRQAFEHFRGKSVFSGLSDEALWDYVNHGLEETPEGDVVLRFPREWEAQIYARPPLDIWQIVPQISAPTLAIRGARSDTLGNEAWHRWQSLQPAAHFIELQDAGHLAPLEQPERLATIICNFLDALDA